MILDYDLQFEPLGIKNSVPQWNVFIGGRKVAYVVERTMAIPKYRVSIEWFDEEFDDKFFASRKEVMQYLLAVVGCMDLN